MQTLLFIIIAALFSATVIFAVFYFQAKRDAVVRVNEVREEARRSADKQEALLREQFDRQLKATVSEMKSATEEMLHRRSQQLTDIDQKRLESLLTPFRKNIDDLRAFVDKSDRENTSRITRLDEAIRLTLQQTLTLGNSADRLANALTSENKTQGNFGEMRLTQLLQDMGFTEGEQFETQKTMEDPLTRETVKTEEGRRLQPDVILHFPDKRDIIIDSKMSVKDYEDYCNSDDETAKAIALKAHIASVRRHADELARKNYSRYIAADHQRIDIVVMYMFSEGALQLALSNDPTLWKEAYNKGVFITGSANLYALLRVLDLAWKNMYQLTNQHEMMEAANVIIERTQDFYTRLLALEKTFDKVHDAFLDLKTTTAPGGKSLPTAAHRLLSYGAKENPKKPRIPNPDEDLQLPVE